MELQDLRVGNVIEYYINETQTWEKNIVDVEDLIMLEKDEEYFLKQYRPVLLASERLEKMMAEGFVSFGNNEHRCFLDSSKKRFLTVLADPFETNRFNSFLEYDNERAIMLNPIKHLHELQNLVFTLTGKELEVIYE